MDGVCQNELLSFHANAFQNSVYSSTGNTVAMTVMILYSCAMFLAGYLSLVRRIKAGTLWKDSLLREVEYSAAHPIRLMGLAVSNPSPEAEMHREEWVEGYLEFEPWPE